MIKRKVIKIDEEKCNGCGLCIPIREVIISIKGEKLKCFLNVQVRMKGTLKPG